MHETKDLWNEDRDSIWMDKKHFYLYFFLGSKNFGHFQLQNKILVWHIYAMINWPMFLCLLTIHSQSNSTINNKTNKLSAFKINKITFVANVIALI